MRRKTIRVKNELPELLEAMCNHEDCPGWLRGMIWDALNDRNSADCYGAESFRYLLAGQPEDEPDEEFKRRMYLSNIEEIDTGDILDSEVLR